MPIYDYSCKNGHSFSEMRSIRDRKQTNKCPDCGQKTHFVVSVSKFKHTFGNADRFWNLREKKRLGKG